jgi:hypothetical protein
VPGSQVCADNVDPTGKVGIGLQAYGGWDLTPSRGYLEAESHVFSYYDGLQGIFARPLGLRRFVIRYYSSPGLDMEFGFNLYRFDASGDASVMDMPLAIGIFQRSSLGD